MKVCITGGGNCYALNLAKHLDSLGIDHFGIGRSPRKHPSLWPIDHDYRYYRYHLISEFDAVMQLLDQERPDIICNFAAQGESAASFGPETHWYYRTNATGMIRFAEAMHRRDYLKRFIQAGTSEVYGSTPGPAKETDVPQPTSPYAISKLTFDTHLQFMNRQHGFPMNILRPSNAYTPGQQLHRIIPRAIIRALSGRRLQLQGGGAAQKSYMHATDLSRAVMAVLQNGEPGKVYNCGPEMPTTIRGLVIEIAELCQVGIDDLVDEVPQRTGEDGRYWLDSSAINRDTGWTPQIGLRAGLEEMVRWVRDNPALLTMDDQFRLAA